MGKWHWGPLMILQHNILLNDRFRLQQMLLKLQYSPPGPLQCGSTAVKLGQEPFHNFDVYSYSSYILILNGCGGLAMRGKARQGATVYSGHFTGCVVVAGD